MYKTKKTTFCGRPVFAGLDWVAAAAAVARNNRNWEQLTQCVDG